MYQVPEWVNVAEVDGESVLLNLKTGHYFGLNESGTRVLNLLREEPLSKEGITQRLLEVYEVNEDVVVRDVEALMTQLAERELVVVAELR